MVLEFQRPPEVPLWTVFRKRGRRLVAGDSIPRVEATAHVLEGDPALYPRVCRFPTLDPLPLTYPTVLARGLQLAVLTHEAFPLRLAGIVHVRQGIVSRRPIHRGEALSGRVWVDGFRPARRGGEFDMHTVVNAGGDEVWHGVTTILSRDLPGDDARRPQVEDSPFSLRRSTTWSVPSNTGRRYATASGDYNPIHLWGLSARLFGFRRAIAHGWWTLARAVAEADTDLPPAVTLEAHFLAPLELPGTATFESGPLQGGTRMVVRGKPNRRGDSRLLVVEARPLAKGPTTR